MSQTKRWWLAFGGCAVAVLGALAWISSVVFDLEAAEHRARVEVSELHTMHTALWRMDAWVAPHLAREAARAADEYESFRSNPQVVSNVSKLQVEPSTILARSPLLNFQSEHIQLHFQLGADGSLTSPQVPEGESYEYSQRIELPSEFVYSNDVRLEQLGASIEYGEIHDRVVAAEDRLTAALRAEVEPETSPIQQQQSGWPQVQSKVQDENRQSTYFVNQTGAINSAAGANGGPILADEDRTTEVGPFVPLWVHGDAGAPQLLFVRRVARTSGETMQGFAANWEQLKVDLLARVADLYPRANLVPVPEHAMVDDESGSVMASIPARLDLPPRKTVYAEIGPGGTAVIFAWIAVSLALLVVGVTLRMSIRDGERRSRFASAVTHELRTPLTTFRMYSEMLADGMVTDEAKRQEYLGTLRDEADRLATLVENVLTYSRLEDGRAPVRIETVQLFDLAERMRPVLTRRADDANMKLRLDSRGDLTTKVNVDVTAVSQIVFNLVDNACKYGASTETPWIDVSIWAQGGELTVEVRDRGPGVRPADRRLIFKPFERTQRAGDEAQPGVGLGLALARGLARELGGDVTLLDESREGATFRLAVPA